MKKTTIFLAASVLVAAATVGATEFLAPTPLMKAPMNQVIAEGARKALNRQNTETFDLAAKLGKEGWYQVDLRKQANMNIFSMEGRTCPVNFQFIEKLGLQKFYGVPFDLLEPAKTDNKTAIALPSQRLLSKELPAKVTVPVGRKAKVLYFLHATYYTGTAGKQYYHIHYADGTEHTMRFIGTKHSGDWAHASTRIYTDDVRYVLVPRKAGSKLSHRNMHAQQWKNPHPDKVVKSITFESDPKVEMAILIVAVTGHTGQADTDKK